MIGIGEKTGHGYKFSFALEYFVISCESERTDLATSEKF